MIAKLIEVGASLEQTREYAIVKDEFLIGRGNDCDLRLRDTAISRHHCLVRVRGDEATVADLGSSNGTYLNGKRIRSQDVLHNGDQLKVGDHAFLVQVGDQDPRTGAVPPDAGATTIKLKDLLKKERSHPPGEAGGEGG